MIAPDSFKGTASAAQIAAAIAEGWSRVNPADRVLLVPMADGGEGTLDALALVEERGKRVPIAVLGPDGGDVRCAWLSLPAGEGRVPTAVVELASTSGITLLTHGLRPFTSHTFGFGQAIAAALDAGAERLLLTLGGSASTDGGAGALRALGARFLDDRGLPVSLGNGGLADIAAVDLTQMRPLPTGGATVLTDVRNPLLGRRGAVAIYGAQKGIDGSRAADAEQALAHFAELVNRAALAAGWDRARTLAARDSEGAGAAGGTGFALRVWGADLESGSQVVARETGLADRINGAALVVTGEGRYDHQSEEGKVPALVRDMAARHGAGTALVAGSVRAGETAFDHVVSLTDLAGDSDAAMADPLRWATEAGEVLAAAVPPWSDIAAPEPE